MGWSIQIENVRLPHGVKIKKPLVDTITNGFSFIGRGGGIRTHDPLLPKQMRYQAALRPEGWRLYQKPVYGVRCTRPCDQPKRPVM